MLAFERRLGLVLTKADQVAALGRRGRGLTLLVLRKSKGVIVVEQMGVEAVVVGRLQKYGASQVVISSCLVGAAQRTTVRWRMRHGSGSRAEEEDN